MTSTQKKSNKNNEPVHILKIASGDLWAGAEVMLYMLTKSLHSDFNVKITVILLNHGTLEQKLRDYGITVYVLDESRYNSLQIFHRLNNIVVICKPDVIHTHGIKENILGSIAAWKNHIPSIRTAHGASEHRPPFYKLPKRLIIFLDRFLGRYYQRFVIAVSSDLAKKLKRSFPHQKIRVIENGIDIESLTINISQQQATVAENNSYRIGIAGRLVPVKRVDLFIETAFYLQQNHPELSIHFYIFGSGPLHASLSARVQSMQADHYIHFEGHCDNIVQELQTLDALLMTSDHEGLPMVLLEAMCLQVPVIAHAVGGIPHLLENGKCGTLIYSQTAEAFAKAIVNRINQPEKHQQLASNAYERIKQRYSASHTASAYLDVYKYIFTHR